MLNKQNAVPRKNVKIGIFMCLGHVCVCFSKLHS